MPYYVEIGCSCPLIMDFMDNFSIGVPFTLLSVCTTIFYSYIHFFSVDIWCFPQYHRIKNEKNEARPFKSENVDQRACFTFTKWSTFCRGKIPLNKVAG